jgi:hypothetical protein
MATVCRNQNKYRLIIFQPCDELFTRWTATNYIQDSYGLFK